MWAYKNRHTQLPKSSGFTIVELLIVIVVIAILAAITIVAYNGIQNRAKASATQQLASQAARKVLAFAVDNADYYPTSLSEAGISDTTGLQYSYNNSSTPHTFGITATNGTISYYVSNDSSGPTAGAYVGHGANGQPAITNLSTNPGFETSSSGPAMVWSASPSRIPAAAITGTNGLRLTCVSGGNTDCGANFGPNISVTSGKTYTYQASLRAQTAGTFASYVTSNSGTTSKIYSPALNVGDIWNIAITKDATGTGAATWYILRSSTAAATFDVDSIIVTEGSTRYVFADGNTSNWIWNGTANVSTSTGSGTAL